MQLLTTKHFNGYALDCYVEPEHVGDFWATREQIGTLLEYADPDNAITIIHKRNKERLDTFSTGVKLTQVEGNREVTREVIVYNFKGLLEICRYSQQPKANAVMDWLWDVADEIRRTGSYSIGKNTVQVDPMQVAKLVFEAAHIKDNQLALALDKVGKHYTGQSMLALAGVTLVAPVQEQLLNPTQIGEHFGVSARKVNQILTDNAYQRKIGNGYEPLEAGEPYAVMLDVNKWHGIGTPTSQLKWRSSIVDELSQYF